MLFFSFLFSVQRLVVSHFPCMYYIWIHREAHIEEWKYGFRIKGKMSSGIQGFRCLLALESKFGGLFGEVSEV